eukprot:1298839-Amphidinium_carterae.5
MLGEVRLAIREDRLRNNIQSSIPGGQSPQRNPVGAGMEGDTRKDCPKFFSNEGCKYGQKCRDRHPETPGRCFICGVPISVHVAKNCLAPRVNKNEDPKGKGASDKGTGKGEKGPPVKGKEKGKDKSGGKKSQRKEGQRQRRRTDGLG